MSALTGDTFDLDVRMRDAGAEVGLRIERLARTFAPLAKLDERRAPASAAGCSTCVKLRRRPGRVAGSQVPLLR